MMVILQVHLNHFYFWSEIFEVTIEHCYNGIIKFMKKKKVE